MSRPQLMPTAPYSSEEELFTRGSNRQSKSAPSLNRPKPKRVVSKRGGGLLPYTAPIESSESLPQDNTERMPPAPTEPLYPPLNLTREKMRVDEERRNIPAPPAPKPNVTHRAAAPPPQRAPPPPRQQQMQQQQRKPPPAGGSNHRTFKLTDFEMPWTIIKVGFRYHTSLGQLEKIFFYLFRFSLTITWGLAIYGSATGDQGGDGAFSPEDQKLWECDTKKPVCEVICFNRFQPVMPARFLLVTMLITVMPDIFFMLAFAKTDAAVKRVTQAKQSMKTISDDKKVKWEAKASSYKQDTLKTNLYLGKAGQLTWSSEASNARLACQVAKFVLDLFFFFAFNWLLQAQYDQHLPAYKLNYSQPWHVYDSRAIMSPLHYQCKAGREYESGCANQGTGEEQNIPCYNPRNNEKTIFNMVIVSLHFLSLIMLGIDVINLARYNNTKRKAKMNEMISAKMN